VYGVNKDSITSYRSRYLYFHGSPYFYVSDAFDAMSEWLEGLRNDKYNNPKGIPHYSAYDTKFFLALGRRVIQDFDLC